MSPIKSVCSYKWANLRVAISLWCHLYYPIYKYTLHLTFQLWNLLVNSYIVPFVSLSSAKQRQFGDIFMHVKVGCLSQGPVECGVKLIIRGSYDNGLLYVQCISARGVSIYIIA